YHSFFALIEFGDVGHALLIRAKCHIAEPDFAAKRSRNAVDDSLLPTALSGFYQYPRSVVSHDDVLALFRQRTQRYAGQSHIWGSTTSRSSWQRGCCSYRLRVSQELCVSRLLVCLGGQAAVFQFFVCVVLLVLLRIDLRLLGFLSLFLLALLLFLIIALRLIVLLLHHLHGLKLRLAGFRCLLPLLLSELINLLLRLLHYRGLPG